MHISLYENHSMVPFTLAAVALLGSPGPGIAALLVAGRTLDRRGALVFYAGLQAGLALAAGLSATGLAALLYAAPFLRLVLLVAATVYLLWLAWGVARAVPGSGGAAEGLESGALSARGGFLLGVTNPKAYLAFASLMGSFTLLAPGGGWTDAAAKWGLCVAVILVVDAAWLAVGVALGRIPLSPPAERRMNLAMGGAIAAAAGLAWI